MIAYVIYVPDELRPVIIDMLHGKTDYYLSEFQSTLSLYCKEIPFEPWMDDIIKLIESYNSIHGRETYFRIHPRADKPTLLPYSH